MTTGSLAVQSVTSHNDSEIICFFLFCKVHIAPPRTRQSISSQTRGVETRYTSRQAGHHITILLHLTFLEISQTLSVHDQRRKIIPNICDHDRKHLGDKFRWKSPYIVAGHLTIGATAGQTLGNQQSQSLLPGISPHRECQMI